MSFDYYIPTKLLFGAGKLNQLATEKLPGQKALIVISCGTSMRKHGYLDRVIDLLKQQNVDAVVYDKILPNPIKEHVMEGAAVAKENGCDFVIGLGGGSSIDAAKAIAIMAKNPGDYWDYIGSGSGKGQPIQNGALPIVAITTTAGTGTEIDPWTVTTAGDEKIGFGDPSCTFPVLSIVDAELMTSVPAHLTAYQGFDALFHSAEGYIANIATPMSDIYALESIRLAAKYLPRAVENGNDIEAREMVALANTLGGMVESTSCVVSMHAFEHGMSGLYPKLPHGAGLIMLCEAFFSTFKDAAPERFAKMAEAMGGTDFVEELVKLQKACGVYGLKMSDYEITEADLPKIVDHSIETMGFLFDLDPKKISKDEMLEILKKSFK